MDRITQRQLKSTTARKDKGWGCTAVNTALKQVSAWIETALKVAVDMSALSLRSSLRLVTVSRAGRGLWRTAPGLSMTVRHGGGGGPRPEPNFVEPNGFLFNEKVLH